MKLLFLLFIIFFSNAAWGEGRSFSEWTPREKTEFFAYAALSYIDYRQTSWAMKQRTPSGEKSYREMNPLFGSNPSNSTLAAGMGVGVAIFYYLIASSDNEETYRTTRAVLLTTRVAVVMHNDSLGVSISRAW